MEPVSKKRKILSHEDKLKIITDIESGIPKNVVAKRLSLAASTISRVWKERDCTLFGYQKSSDLTKHRRSEQNEVADALLVWCQKQEKKKRRITGTIFRAKAEELARQLKLDEEFVCTKSWMDRFKARNNISFGGGSRPSQGDRWSGESSQEGEEEDEEAEDEEQSCSGEESEEGHKNGDLDGGEEVKKNGHLLDENGARSTKGATSSGCAPGTSGNSNSNCIKSDLSEEFKIQMEAPFAAKKEQSKRRSKRASDGYSSDSNDCLLMKPPEPSLYNCVEAIRTISEYYQSQKMADNVMQGRVKLIRDDLEQRYWDELQTTMEGLIGKNNGESGTLKDDDDDVDLDLPED